MNKKQLETVIIGGGQAGLSTAYHLTQRDVPCTILDENDRIGAAWRKRWSSLRLFTPGRYDSLPGMSYPGPPGSFPGKDEIADYLESYAARFNIAVKKGVKAERVSKEDDHYAIETNKGTIIAYSVVVATGPFHHPRIPDFGGKLKKHIIRIHSSEYQSPDQVNDGPVLVVGAGQSGTEIALDMARTGHDVWLSGRDPGQEPIVRDTFTGRMIIPLMVFAARRIINVANPLGRKLRKYLFYPPRGIPRAGGTRELILKAGIKWVGRMAGIHEGYPQLEDGRVLKVNSVIWCTGFVTDYSWIDLPIFDDYGFPSHRCGIVRSHPGLYFIGMPFQRTLSSSLLMGVGRDAGFIASHIASRQKIFKVNRKTSIRAVVSEDV